MSTPILEGLQAHLRRERASFHMPGHKGRMAPLSADYDVTEVFDTGDLFSGGDFIEEAERLWAEAWGMGVCQFLTGGSTQGIHAALLLCRRRGEGILVDRGCHRSVYNALGMFDFTPHYLLRAQDQPITVEMVERAAEGKRISTLCITSPTYYGVISDVSALSRWCRERNVQLVVDGAHGAHLPFLQEENPFAPAGLVISSAHKTLPVYGQGAVLLAGRDSGFSEEELRWACSVTGSSSPSYPILLSLDLARERFTTPEGREELRETAAWAEKFRRRFPSLAGEEMDPMRLTLLTGRGQNGFQLQQALERRGIVPEMADLDHVVFLFSPNNTEQDYALLWRALEELEKSEGRNGEKTGRGRVEVKDPQKRAQDAASPARHHVFPRPEVVLSPRQAMLSPRVMGGSVWDSVGRISARQVAPYPPGIPIIAPGERITEKTIAFLREIGYNDRKPIEWISQGE